MEKSIRFVVLGTGNICRTYLKAAEAVDSAAIVGFVSRSERRPAYLPDHLPIAARLDDIPVDFDAVILATPNGLHWQGALAAAELGKHVLTEKPLDVSSKHAAEMIAVCRNAGVALGVAYQHRTVPDNRTVKSLLEKRAFGRVYGADFTVRCWRDQAYYDSAEWRGGWAIDGGGPFIQQASHQIDLYCWFFGLPEEVVAMTGTFAHNIEVEDHGAALFRHADGMIGTFVASTIAVPGFDPVLTIYTEKGTVIMENGNITGWHIKDMENPSCREQGVFHSGASSAAVADTAGHEMILADFAEAARTGREPMITGESARLATELVLKIYARQHPLK